MSDLKFRTSEECLVKLVAHTVMADKYDIMVRDPLEDEEAGADWMPVTAARVSYNNDDKTGLEPEKDAKLMKYLADHKHLGVFEHQSVTFVIECPLFVRSQIHRHRTFSYNEISRRYTDDDLGFWMPSKWRKQSDKNKQGSTEEEVEYMWGPATDEDPYELTMDTAYKDGVYGQHNQYQAMLKLGVAKELARAVLPQSALTRFYMSGNLRNWAHFLTLRLDSHSQYEVRVVAEKIKKELEALWPEAMQALLPVTSD